MQKYSLRCLKAICALNGGRDELSKKMDLKEQTINRWIWAGSVPKGRIKELVALGNNKFEAGELLGFYDKER